MCATRSADGHTHFRRVLIACWVIVPSPKCQIIKKTFYIFSTANHWPGLVPISKYLGGL